MGPAGLGRAGRPKKWPKFFENFCEVLLNADFQKIKHALVENQICLCRDEAKCMQEKLIYPICNAMMDTYHEPHGAGSGFESGAGLSLPLARLSSLGRVSDDDPFFCHTFLGVGFDSTSFFSDFINFLLWILRLAFL